MEFNFEQNLEVENIEDVPEDYRGLYEEGGEKGYKIADHAKPLVDAYVGTNKSLSRERNAKTQANDEAKTRRLALKELEGLAEEYGMEIGDDGLPSAFKKLVEDLSSKAKNGDQLKVDLDKVRDTMKKQQDEVVANKDKEIQSRDKALEKILIRGEAASALAEAKGSSKLLMPHIQQSTKVIQNGTDDDGAPIYEVRVLDEDGEYRTNGKGGFMGVQELIQEMKDSKDFASAFESETPGGGGAGPGKPPKGPSKGKDLSPSQKISQGLDKRSNVRR